MRYAAFLSRVIAGNIATRQRPDGTWQFALADVPSSVVETQAVYKALLARVGSSGVLTMPSGVGLIAADACPLCDAPLVSAGAFGAGVACHNPACGFPGEGAKGTTLTPGAPCPRCASLLAWTPSGQAVTCLHPGCGYGGPAHVARRDGQPSVISGGVLPFCYPLESERVAGAQQVTTPQSEEMLPLLPFASIVEIIGEETSIKTEKEGVNSAYIDTIGGKRVAKGSISSEDTDYPRDTPATLSPSKGSRRVAGPEPEDISSDADIVPLPSPAAGQAAMVRCCPYCKADKVRFFKGTRGVCYACGKQSPWEEKP